MCYMSERTDLRNSVYRPECIAHRNVGNSKMVLVFVRKWLLERLFKKAHWKSAKAYQLLCGTNRPVDWNWSGPVGSFIKSCNMMIVIVLWDFFAQQIHKTISKNLPVKWSSLQQYTWKSTTLSILTFLLIISSKNITEIRKETLKWFKIGCLFVWCCLSSVTNAQHLLWSRCVKNEPRQVR